LKIGAEGNYLSCPSKTAGTDARTFRQRIEGDAFARGQHIARIFARGNRSNRQVRLIDQRHRHGNIFETVDGEIDFVLQQREFEFFGEEALPAEFVQRFVGDEIAAGFDDDQVDMQARMTAHEFIGDLLALGAGEERSTSAETHSPKGKRKSGNAQGARVCVSNQRLAPQRMKVFVLFVARATSP